jgi:diaminopimelate decarboxylase
MLPHQWDHLFLEQRRNLILFSEVRKGRNTISLLKSLISLHSDGRKRNLTRDEIVDILEDISQSSSTDHQFQDFMKQTIRLSGGENCLLQLTLPLIIFDKIESSPSISQTFKLSEVLARYNDLVRQIGASCQKNYWHSEIPQSRNNIALMKMIQFDALIGQADDEQSVVDPASFSLALIKLLQSVNTSDSPLYTAILYDLDHLQHSFQSVKTSFPPNFLHCYAIKSCPLPYLLHRAVKSGLGLEAASMVELKLALQSGCEPSKIMFDSPCKSFPEIFEALKFGVCINANSLRELEKIRLALCQLSSQGMTYDGMIALRINPLVGKGTIAELSTADETSKFGVQLTAETKNQILQCYREHAFLNGLMCHVGSQGISLEQMVQAVDILCNFANEIDSSCGTKRIEMIDIGGGLPVNYDSDEITPLFVDYSSLLEERCHLSIQNRHFVTEFGKAYVLKAGKVITKVEDILTPQETALSKTAIVHAGSDLFMRPAYVPSKFYHRISVLDSFGNRKRINHQDCNSYNIAGPLCHSADFIAKDLHLPLIEIDDYLLIHDAGANTLSTFSKHCSRLMPPVYVFKSSQSQDMSLPSSLKREKDLIKLLRIKEGETVDRAMAFWE